MWRIYFLKFLFIWLLRVLVAAHGIFHRGAWALSSWRVGSSWQCAGFSLVVVHGLSCPVACGIPVPRPGIEPTSPALEGGLLTTGPPGKSLEVENIFLPQWCWVWPCGLLGQWDFSEYDTNKNLKCACVIRSVLWCFCCHHKNVSWLPVHPPRKGNVRSRPKSNLQPGVKFTTKPSWPQMCEPEGIINAYWCSHWFGVFCFATILLQKLTD